MGSGQEGGWEEQPTPEARGSGREDQPHVQGAVAALVQEGLEELCHTEGQDPEFTQTQTHVHRVGDAIQPFYPLSSPGLTSS